jgi:hypothetical protein
MSDVSNIKMTLSVSYNFCSTECGDEIAAAGSVTTQITVLPVLVADAGLPSV